MEYKRSQIESFLYKSFIFWRGKLIFRFAFQIRLEIDWTILKKLRNLEGKVNINSSFWWSDWFIEPVKGNPNWFLAAILLESGLWGLLVSFSFIFFELYWRNHEEIIRKNDKKLSFSQIPCFHIHLHSILLQYSSKKIKRI